MLNTDFYTANAIHFRKWKPCLLGPEQRSGISNMQLGAAMLSHAVAYLLDEQLAGRQDPVQANREAVQILCQAGEKIANKERRKPERRLIAAWLREARQGMSSVEV